MMKENWSKHSFVLASSEQANCLETWDSNMSTSLEIDSPSMFTGLHAVEIPKSTQSSEFEYSSCFYDGFKVAYSVDSLINSLQIFQNEDRFEGVTVYKPATEEAFYIYAK
ncbi:hypothetical protein [Aliidiomarina sp. B3213]|uniref:hypothetical protein n=1 Tax=Aliidiomarina sp. B3213 TaxID=2249757 RepID=UPI000F801F4D|nr:hypothetical protein [Aliidiomarina sp. B3213]RTE85927.1 hypothetical protein DQX04_10820 [Aliidiomarina sp. B3213]